MFIKATLETRDTDGNVLVADTSITFALQLMATQAVSRFAWKVISWRKRAVRKAIRDMRVCR